MFVVFVLVQDISTKSVNDEENLKGSLVSKNNANSLDSKYKKNPELKKVSYVVNLRNKYNVNLDNIFKKTVNKHKKQHKKKPPHHRNRTQPVRVPGESEEEEDDSNDGEDFDADIAEFLN